MRSRQVQAKKGSVVTNFVPLPQDQATTCRPGSKPYDWEAMAHEVTMDLRVLFKKESCEARWDPGHYSMQFIPEN